MRIVVRNHQLVRTWIAPWWVRFGWNLASGLGVVILASAQYADQKIDPHKAHWLHSDLFQFSLAGIVFGAIGVDSFRRSVRRFRAHSESSQRLQIRDILMSLLATLADTTPALAADLGAGLYIEQQRFRQPRSALKRAVRVRLIDSIPDSGISFTPGKGAVGSCWQTRREQFHDWSPVNRAHAGAPPERSQWQKHVSTKSRFGFEYDEWMRLLGRHAEVAAVPITDSSGKLVGVLAVDRAWEEDGVDSPPLFKHREVKKTLGLTAKLLAEALA